MNSQHESLETLREIRSLMERSSRFLSLSGLAGVVAGIAALSGIAAVYLSTNISLTLESSKQLPTLASHAIPDSYWFLFEIMLIVLLLSLSAATWLSWKRARKAGLPIWDATAKRMLINLGIPLLAGGLYCLSLLYQGLAAFVVPSTLIFYGLALVHASKYTRDDIRYLGLLEIICGLFANFFIAYSLLLWAFGFGILHIIYGILMYIKYER